MIDVVFAAATYLPPDTLVTIFEADSLPVSGGSLFVSIPGSFLASAEALERPNLPGYLQGWKPGYRCEGDSDHSDGRSQCGDRS